MAHSAHSRRRRTVQALVALLWVFPPALPATGQTSRPDSGQPSDPLATKQQIIRDRMTQLEDRMFRLSEKLGGTEPEQAKRLEGALRQARELLIRRNMEEAAALLEAGRLSEASERETSITRDLERVLQILMEEPDRSQERREEIERLKSMQEEVKALLEAERTLKARADAAPRLENLLAGIQAAIARLESMIGRQQKLTEDTTAAREAEEVSLASKLQAEQNKLRQEAESLAESMSGAAGRPSPSDTGTPGDQNPTSAPATPSEQTPADTQTTTRPAESQQSAHPDTEAALEQGIRRAGSETSGSAEHMKSAEESLERGRLPESVPEQENALEKLRRALQELKRQEESAKRQLDQAEAAKKQRELRQRAGKLSDQMQGKDAAQQGQSQDSPDGRQQDGGKQQDGNQQQGNQQGQQDSQRPGEQEQHGDEHADAEQSPGREHVEEAGHQMDNAAENLDKNSPSEASKDQQRAIDELEQAQRELQDVLEQKRREQQEEILRSLEARFRAMLDQQLGINRSTEELSKRERSLWTHADELAVAGLSEQQSKLATDAGDALHILKEEGSTIVFPNIVTQMQEDMSESARLLADKRADEPTQRVQAEIVRTLKELLEAIEQMQQELQQQQQQAQSGQPNPSQQTPPLLPDSAELKLLRACQERINRRTVAYAEEYREKTLGPAEVNNLNRLAERQRDVADMARKMHERVTGQ